MALLFNLQVIHRRAIVNIKAAREIVVPQSIRKCAIYRLLQNWLFQGFAGAHWEDIVFRLAMEMTLFFVLLMPLLSWAHRPYLLAVIITHTLMWLFNGHFWALKISENARLVRNTPERISRYLGGLQRRVERAESVTACVLSGSLCRGRFHEYSDLDVWFTRKRGFRNGLSAHILIVRERSIAFLQRIPIELYLFDPEDYRRNDPKDPLLLLKDIQGLWRKAEPNSRIIRADRLTQMEYFSHNQQKELE